MNEEEKKAVKYFYNLRATIDESNMLFDEEINVKHGKETIKQITIILNLVEKLQKENEEKTTILLAGAEKVKQLEKENNRLEEQVEYDKTHIYTPQTIELNFILKSKIEDKIEELKINLVNMQGEELLIYESKIEALQELLEENENHIPRIN